MNSEADRRLWRGPDPIVYDPKRFRDPELYAALVARNTAIYLERLAGATLSLAGKYGRTRERIRQIFYRIERIEMARRKRWRPIIRQGHPSFDDAYGVDHVSTPIDVWLER